MKELKIPVKFDDSSVNIALDTIALGKQVIFFVNSKRGAEALAEKIALKRPKTDVFVGLSEEGRSALPKATRQCHRLASVLLKGVAFHHAGLHSKQREIVEENFRKSVIKVICATPTLCLSGSSRIWTGISGMRVDAYDRRKPLFVLAKDRFSQQKAKSVEKVHNSLDLIRVSSVSGYSIGVTPHHRMLVKRAGKRRILPANRIVKGDRIGTVGKLTLLKTKNPWVSEFIEDNSGYSPDIQFDQRLSYLIGAMLGDGYSGAETKNGIVAYKGSPALVGRDDEIFMRVKEACTLLKIPCRQTMTFHGTPQLILGKHKFFREFLVRCGVEKGKNKHISEKLMMMDRDNISELLRGLFDTDGFVQKDCGPGFCSISKDLVEQVQRLLLRFHIVTSLRTKKGSVMRMYDKEYKTQMKYELGIFNKRCIFDFYRYIGFSVRRKQDALMDMVARIASNVHYVSCDGCGYRLYGDLFSGRTNEQKEWGRKKQQIIMLLGKRGELPSNEVKRLLGFDPRKSEKRLNHHYELIQKRKLGNISKTEWFWSLNDIGSWIYKNVLSRAKKYIEVFGTCFCPLCGKQVKWTIKKGWRENDFEGDIFWDKIREIKRGRTEDYVYDVVLPLHSANDHLFVAEGFIVHNSYGLDLPAFRVVVRDVKRFGRGGMDFIPVLEFEQMCGRAGRPGKEEYGEALAVAGSEREKEKLIERYLKGKPEVIYSKLAVEPVLRTYILSLVASEFVHDISSLMAFFGRTFYAHQFKDLYEMKRIIMKMLGLLEEWEFIKVGREGDFRSADEIVDSLEATPVGKRVSELYLDPLSANYIIRSLRNATGKRPGVFSFLFLISRCNEISPRLKVRMAEYDVINEKYVEHEKFFLEEEPSEFSPEFEEFMDAFKTALFFEEWAEEKDEEFLLESYNIRPGEIHVKLDLADWLIYCTEELARMQGFHYLMNPLAKLRLRLQYGIKEELLALIKLKNVGRARARMLFRNGIKTLADIRKADLGKLSTILGPKIAKDVKKQVGETEAREMDETLLGK